jgi:uncharacterized protein
MHVALARVPVGSDVELTVMLEVMPDGVLVSAEASAPVEGECARCLEPVTTSVRVSFRELYERGVDPASQENAEDDRRFLDGDLLDLEPALRDAMVLALPLAPLCRDDCAGLCPECGARLADAGPEHSTTARWTRGGPGCASWTRENCKAAPAPRIDRRAEVAVPKRRMSRSNTRSRRSQWRTTAPTLVSCPQCHEPKLPHVACPTCGTYKRRQVITPS